VIKFKELVKEAGGAGDWGTDKARKRLQQDTPGQSITDIGAKNKERKESVELDEGKVIKIVADHPGPKYKAGQVIKTFPETTKGLTQAMAFQATLKTKHGVHATMVRESVELEEKLKVSDGLGAWIDDFQKSDAPQFKNADEKKRRDMAIAAFVAAGGKLDEGTLAARDESIIDSMLSALKQKLIKDLQTGNMKDAQEVAKLVKMTIEKDYKHKGFSRLKR